MTTSYDIYRDWRASGLSQESIHCESISARGQKLAWQLDAHRHYDLHQFFWITRGGGRARIDGFTHGFGANTAFYIPNMTVHGFEFTPSTVGWVVSIVSNLPISLPRGVMMSVLPSPTEQSYLTGAFNGINGEYIADNDGRHDALLHHAGLLSLRFQRMKTDGLRAGFTKDNARRRLMRKFIERLEDRYASPDTVKDYAGDLGVTTTHLTRICRETTGRPATKLIQDRTMLEARRNLAHTNLRVARIADNLGFQTPAYFSRVFSANTGKSPRAFRYEAQIRAKSNPNTRQAV
ncbi:MAG: helix-turn-helix domain-containing protein [Paracoccaceae bacterium]